MTVTEYFGPQMQGCYIKTCSATEDAVGAALLMPSAYLVLCVGELINPHQAHALIPLFFNKGKNLGL